jgi:hypothetical protein
MTLRVFVLRFIDSPVLDDLEEVPLETTRHSVQVGDVALGF